MGIFAAIGLVTSLAGTARQHQGSKKAAKVKTKINNVNTIFSRRQAIRNAQRVRARAEATAVGTGAVQSSGFKGGVSSINSQVATQLGQQSRLNFLNRDLGDAQSLINSGAALSSLGGSISGLGETFSKAASGIGTTPDLTTPVFGGK